MTIVYSKNSVPIRLTVERWEHIKRRHPEMENQQQKLMETISKPDVILEGDFGELLAARQYESTPPKKKFLVAVYREISDNDGFVITAYFSNALLKRRKIIWKR